MTVLVDTREQKPYRFSKETWTQPASLKTGDYSLPGQESTVAIERKSLDDFVQSVTHGRARFLREMERLSEFTFKAVVVEADAQDVLNGNYRSEAHPNSVFGTAIKIYVDYGVPVFFLSDRFDSQLFVEKFLRRVKSQLQTESA